MGTVIWRVSVAAISLLLALTRFYYAWGARRSRPRTVTARAAPWQRAWIWSSGLLAAAASAIYVVAPTWLAWAALPLPDALRLAGVGLGLLTVLLFLWIHQALGRNWAMPAVIQEGHSLITHGPYRWVRHPMYSLLFVWAAAYFLISANGLIGLAWLALALAAVAVTGAEEEALTQYFGEAYRAYRRQTGKFLPRL